MVAFSCLIPKRNKNSIYSKDHHKDPMLHISIFTSSIRFTFDTIISYNYIKEWYKIRFVNFDDTFEIRPSFICHNSLLPLSVPIVDITVAAPVRGVFRIVVVRGG